MIFLTKSRYGKLVKTDDEEKAVGVYLTVAEYEEYQNGRKEVEFAKARLKEREFWLEVEVESTKIKYEDDAQKEADERFQREFDNLESYIKSLEDENEDLKKQVDEKIYDNETLAEQIDHFRKIMKERSNAEREVQPKKWRDGYIAISCTQASERYEVAVDTFDPTADLDLPAEDRPKKQVRYIPSWHTVLQSPYTTELPYPDVKAQVEHDFKYRLLDDMQCRREEIPADGDLGKLVRERPEDNLVIGVKYRINYRLGAYWEVEIATTKYPYIAPKRIQSGQQKNGNGK